MRRQDINTLNKSSVINLYKYLKHQFAEKQFWGIPDEQIIT